MTDPPSVAEAEAVGDAVGADPPALLPIEAVRPSPFRVRLVLDVAAIRELEEEAQRTKTVEPVVVWERFDETGLYVVLEGEWRRRVALRAGLKLLPVRVRVVRDERDAEVQTLVAELRKWGPTAVAEGEAYARLVELGLTQTEIATAVHKEKSTVSKRLRLVRLPEEVRVLIDAGVLNGKQGQELARFLDRPALFKEMVRRAVEGASSRKLAAMQAELGVQAHKTGLGAVTWGRDGEHSDYGDYNTESYRLG